jgi:hypothetical protein
MDCKMTEFRKPDFVKQNQDIPPAAGRVHRKPEGSINSDNQAGGEVNREKYTTVGVER